MSNANICGRFRCSKMVEKHYLKFALRLAAVDETHAQEKYSVLINLMSSLRKFYLVILQYQLLPRLAYFQSSSSGQNNIIMSEVAKLISEYQLNFQKHVNICCCSFDKISIKKKNCAARNFDLMINFNFF